MLNKIEEMKEKKVEYLELIYDLIFVYLIGRNNSLLHTLQNGFISADSFLVYITCTLAVIQVWSYSTFYINRYGRNGVRDHIFIFVNMYLLYYMAEGTRMGWQSYYNQYNVAWTLILANHALQYFLERRNHKDEPWNLMHINISAGIIFTEAIIVAVSIPIYNLYGKTLAVIAILFGMLATFISGGINKLVPVDFEHLTERIMLYVVFTFGEMIIAVASYFGSGFSAGTVYFSVMAFLIVVGLFLSYGRIYDHITDRKKVTSGTGYMLIHVFIIFALNNITTALEFMREEEAELTPKIIFISASFVVYYLFLFLLGIYSKKTCKLTARFIALMLCAAAGFLLLMLLLRNLPYMNILISVIYVFGIFVILYLRPTLKSHKKSVTHMSDSE